VSDTLHTEPERDQFRTESPIRAFTDWQVNGRYAIGKGFRPSLAHVVNYLEAMESKEGWQLVQVLEAATQTPSFMFRKRLPPFKFYTEDGEREDDEPYIRNREGFEEAARKMDEGRAAAEELDRRAAAANDPLNPKHYSGRDCADIGERLTANGYQVLKYCWRLGRKDDPVQELGKALWYIDSEVALLGHPQPNTVLYAQPHTLDLDDPLGFLERRIAQQPPFTQEVARFLWSGYSAADLLALRVQVESEKTYLECGRGQEP